MNTNTGLTGTTETIRRDHPALMATGRTPRWLMRISAPPRPQARLICLPYAGGGTVAYRAWPWLLPAWLEIWAVLLPGRETRINDPPVADFSSLIRALT